MVDLLPDKRLSITEFTEYSVDGTPLKIFALDNETKARVKVTIVKTKSGVAGVENTDVIQTLVFKERAVVAFSPIPQDETFSIASYGPAGLRPILEYGPQFIGFFSPWRVMRSREMGTLILGIGITMLLVAGVAVSVSTIGTAGFSSSFLGKILVRILKRVGINNAEAVVAGIRGGKAVAGAGTARRGLFSGRIFTRG